MVPSPRLRSGARIAAALACLALAASASASASASAASIGAYTTRGAWAFVSAPGLHPPKLSGSYARGAQRSLGPGLFLASNFPNLGATGPMTGQGGPLILDDHLQPVWSYPVGTGLVAADLQQATYAGQPVLLWWQGIVTRTGATRSGQVVVLNQHYRRIAAVRARAPWVISLHDALISGQNLWVTVYRSVGNQDLRRYGGLRRGTVYDVGVQEFDLKSRRLVYTWDALNPGHAARVPLSDSEQPPPRAPATPWDAYHINSLQVLGAGRILISMRNTWGVYLLDTATQRVLWTLGGRHSSFKLSGKARFTWQHDARLVSGNELTLFADNCCRLEPTGSFAAPSGPSEGMLLRLNAAKHTASRVAGYFHRPDLHVAYLGSMQLLPGGNALVGWGSLPYFTEFSASGRPLLDANWPGKDQSYRVLYTSGWMGTPYYPPSGAARRRSGRVTVYASWNGATEVARWQALAGASPQAMTVVATGSRHGFETALRLPSGTYKSFEVRALDATGATLGTSKPFGLG